MLVQRSTQSESRIVGQYEVSGNEADGRKTAFWSSVLNYVIESFALYAASIHPVALFPVEPRPHRRDMAHSGQVFRPGRRGLLTLVSTTASPEASWRRPEPTTSPAPPAGCAIDLVGATQREVEIEKAVAALAEFDDRTLRDLGIPHRSLIERTVRYCHDC
jgi:uncharacterized protein YjiS (DUF1127 family)